MLPPPIVQGAVAEARLRSGSKQVVVAGPVPEGGFPPTLSIHPAIQALRTADRRRWNDIQRDLARLLRQIAGPADIDDRYYRRSRDRRGDRLLLSPLRILHLHLLNPGSDVLLYVIQTADAVILVELGPHTHLEHTPPGKSFRTDHIRRAGRLVMPHLPPHKA